MDVGIKFGPFPHLEDLKDIGAHLCTYAPGHSGRDVSKADLADSFATRPHALTLILRWWLFHLDHFVRTASADVDDGLEFCLHNPGLVDELMRADWGRAPLPLRLSHALPPG